MKPDRCHKNPLLQFDQNMLSGDTFQYLIGVDEAGRGPLAGPVVAAAVCLSRMDFSLTIQDSKKMTERQRNQAFVEIFDRASVGIGIMSEAVIDRHNILQATFLAMNAAIRQLTFRLQNTGAVQADSERAGCLLIDGNRFPSDFAYGVKTIVHGDSRSLSIACASVIAKVTRDRILRIYDRIFPQYGLARHKGYPTAAHREALKQYGPSLIHRKTFGPVLASQKD